MNQAGDAFHRSQPQRRFERPLEHADLERCVRSADRRRSAVPSAMIAARVPRIAVLEHQRAEHVERGADVEPEQQAQRPRSRRSAATKPQRRACACSRVMKDLRRRPAATAVQQAPTTRIAEARQHDHHPDVERERARLRPGWGPADAVFRSRRSWRSPPEQRR